MFLRDMIATKNSESLFEVDPQRAVEFRNKKKALVIFIPTQFADLTSSLQDFTERSLSTLMLEVYNDYRLRNQSVGLPTIGSGFLANIQELAKVDRLLKFFVDSHHAVNPID